MFGCCILEINILVHKLQTFTFLQWFKTFHQSQNHQNHQGFRSNFFYFLYYTSLITETVVILIFILVQPATGEKPAWWLAPAKTYRNVLLFSISGRMGAATQSIYSPEMIHLNDNVGHTLQYLPFLFIKITSVRHWIVLSFNIQIYITFSNYYSYMLIL